MNPSAEFIRLLTSLGLSSQRRFRRFLRAIALTGGLIAAYQVEVLLETQRWYASLWWYLGVAVAAGLEFVFADVLADQAFPFDTERRLALMENRLGASTIGQISGSLQTAISRFSACDTTLVSATVHIIVELEGTQQHPVHSGLLQLTNYVGRLGGRKGRITLINQGLIGRCARTGKVETVDFATLEEYRELMVKDFGFTQEETERHTNNARSYLAYPLRRGATVVGVIYFFTTEPQVFPDAIDTRELLHLEETILGYLQISGLA